MGKNYNSGYNKKKNQGKRNNNYNKNNRTAYVGAPYNFVPFSREVYHYPEDKLTKHSDMAEELMSGEITYTIKAETPVFVGDGRKDSQGTELFHQNERGNYAIQGSTIRGLIRNNVQILGLAEIGDDVDDYALMYRAVAGGMEKKRYEEVLGAKQINVGKNKQIMLSVLGNVKAGYIEQVGGKFSICSACHHSIGDGSHSMNYYVLSERVVLENQDDYPFFTAKPEERMMYQLNCRSKEQTNKGEYELVKNDRYKPYYKKASYEVSGNRIIKVGEEGQFSKSGYVVSSGFIMKKKAVYIIPEEETNEEKRENIEVPDEDVRAFRIDLAKRENTLTEKRFGGKKFFDLPSPKERKPVFYIYLNGRLYFGFTPRLRLFYDHTIKEGMDKKHKEGRIDYAKALFGYAKKDKAYKSKISFSDAVVQGAGQGLEDKRRELVLLEPKPTSYMDYVTPNFKNKPVTYNAPDFELRGVKQYWLKKETPPAKPADPKLKKVVTKFYPVSQGTEFTGKVRFQNLIKDELGLLLWSIQLNKDSQMNIGKGKPYGFGRISVRLNEVKILDLQRAYHVTDGLDLDPFRYWGSDEINDCIQYYKDTVSQCLPKGTIDDLPHIQEFFMIKDGTNIPDDEKTRYMSLEKREYQDRVCNKQSLSTISQIVKKK